VLSTASIAKVVTAANPGRFRAVAGRDPARAAAFAASTGIERTFADYAAMLASDENRRGLHRPARLDAHVADGRGAPGGQARAVREAVRLVTGRRGELLRRGRGGRVCPRASCGAPTRRP
jgi:hypothetical protein